jgi:C_GCAxxG_C_C family probable redox protein
VAAFLHAFTDVVLNSRERNSPMNNVEQAVSLFKDGFNCSQAVFASYAPRFGMDRELALKVSCGFGGGVGRTGGACGALAGAVMVIGLKYGRTRIEDEAAKVKTYDVVRELVSRFRSRNKTIMCTELTGCDLSTPEGVRAANEKKIHADVCPKFVRDAAEILEEML